MGTRLVDGRLGQELRSLTYVLLPPAKDLEIPKGRRENTPILKVNVLTLGEITKEQ